MDKGLRHRLFVAIELAEPAHAALDRAVQPLREAHPGLRWNDPSTWHVTLAFLGGVPVQRAPEVDAAAAQAAQRPPLPVRLDGRAGSFSGGVFFAVVEESPELLELAVDLNRHLAAVGFATEDRRFIPHCTLARVPRGSRLPGPLLGGYDGPAVTWTARRLIVVRSHLQVGGVAHEVRSAAPFAEVA